MNEENRSILDHSRLCLWLCRRFQVPEEDAGDEVLMKTLLGNAFDDKSLSKEKAIELIRDDGDDCDDDNQFLNTKGARDMTGQETEMPTRADVANALMGRHGMMKEGQLQSGAYARHNDPGVKVANRCYSKHREVGLHVKTERPVCLAVNNDQPQLCPSEHDYAVAGVYLKRVALRSGIDVAWFPEDEALWNHVCKDVPWVGLVGNEWRREIRGLEIKALLDDTTSGGGYLNPTPFDQAVITTPVLFGELYPFVDVVDVPRGSSIEGASMTNPTVTWGGTEGTAASLFDTASLFSQTSNSFHEIAVHIETGRDFMADSAVDVGRLLVQQIGLKFRESLDEQIAIGDGTSEPEGIFTASGVTTANSSNGTSGPFALGDFEALSLTAGKQYLNAAWNPAYVTSHYMYRQARSIPVGSADARRLLGMDHSKYNILEWRCGIQDSISNGSVAFGPLKMYRMYRRLGMQVKWTSEGQTLQLRNTTLLTVRGRFGGFLTLGSAFCKMTDGPTSYGN